MNDMKSERIEILRSSAQGRREGVMNYQINIDNFALAIKKIESCHMDKPHMVAFADQLRAMMRSNIEEQDKERVILEVIEMQLVGE